MRGSFSRETFHAWDSLVCSIEIHTPDTAGQRWEKSKTVKTVNALFCTGYSKSREPLLSEGSSWFLKVERLNLIEWCCLLLICYVCCCVEFVKMIWKPTLLK